MPLREQIRYQHVMLNPIQGFNELSKIPPEGAVQGAPQKSPPPPPETKATLPEKSE